MRAIARKIAANVDRTERFYTIDRLLRARGVVSFAELAERLEVSRATLKRGDQILRIQGVDVAKMEEGQAQSLINANAQTGVSMRIKSADGTERELSLKEGPIYPHPDEDIRIEG